MSAVKGDTVRGDTQKFLPIRIAGGVARLLYKVYRRSAIELLFV